MGSIDRSNTEITKPGFSNEQLSKLVIPKYTEFINQQPTVKQQAFMLLDHYKDAFFGGAAGGGKSSALLMCALQYVDCPGYNAVLIRNTFKQLDMPDSLMNRAFEWLNGSTAIWLSDKKRWRFPSGATLSFGYLDGPLDHFNFLGAAYQFIGIDEVVGIRENQALYLFSRMRKLEKYSHVPLRFRCTSNPPTREQLARGEWVKKRYILDGKQNNRPFIPSFLEDNPYLEKESYIQNLMELDPVTREQLLRGNWDIRVKGALFDPIWFQIVDYPVSESIQSVRFWDLAATEETGKNDPDYTVGVLASIDSNKIITVQDVQRFRKTPAYTKLHVKHQAVLDGKSTYIRMEQEPGSSGKLSIDEFTKHLMGYNFKGIRASGSKILRASPVSSYAESGKIKLVQSTWNQEFLNELMVFPSKEYHDDQVDALSGAFDFLAGASKKVVRARWI